jgi:hypothetical protein
MFQESERSGRLQEREKSLLISQLTEQNQRLTSQLKDVSTSPDILDIFLQNFPMFVEPSLFEHSNVPPDHP